jgi:plastocyanin
MYPNTVHNVSQINGVFLSTMDLKEGDTFSFTFDKAGTYRYQRTFRHPNMNGVVIVEE